MKMLLLLYLSLAVVMAMPPLDEGNEEVKSSPELLDMKQSQNVALKNELAESKVTVESGVKLEGAVKLKPEAELDVSTKPEVETQPELVGDPDFKVRSEVKLEPAVLEKLEPKEESNETQGVLVKLNLEAPEADQKLGEEQGDMEKPVLEDPAFDREQDDDDGMSEQEPGKAEEVSEVKARAFEPVRESIEKYEGVPESILPETEEDGPALDSMGQKMRSVEEYFPIKEAGVNNSQVEELKSDFSPVEEEMGMTAMVEDGGEAVAQQTAATRQRYCPGVILDGKCYQFFREPRRAESAEFFCQERFPRGHLASITSAFVHRELMKLIRRQNGSYTRTWIGGLRYLQTNHFIWLDGSRWQYADWLSGEPNHTAGLENCVEVLPWGNGKFNDFTCWEPQAFICSHPYQ